MKEKNFIVDFESWIISAENEDDVLKKVEDRISTGEIPRVILVDEN